MTTYCKNPSYSSITPSKSDELSAPNETIAQDSRLTAKNNAPTNAFDFASLGSLSPDLRPASTFKLTYAPKSALALAITYMEAVI